MIKIKLTFANPPNGNEGEQALCRERAAKFYEKILRQQYRKNCPGVPVEITVDTSGDAETLHAPGDRESILHPPNKRRCLGPLGSQNPP